MNWIFSHLTDKHFPSVFLIRKHTMYIFSELISVKTVDDFRFSRKPMGQPAGNFTSVRFAQVLRFEIFRKCLHFVNNSYVCLPS